MHTHTNPRAEGRLKGSNPRISKRVLTHSPNSTFLNWGSPTTGVPKDFLADVGIWIALRDSISRSSASICCLPKANLPDLWSPAFPYSSFAACPSPFTKERHILPTYPQSYQGALSQGAKISWYTHNRITEDSISLEGESQE